MIGNPQGKRDDGEIGVGMAPRCEHRAAGYVQVLQVVDPAVAIDHAMLWI
jgi:hypothetical protein